MVAEAACCTCRECGAICRGRFNGCPTVWASASTVTYAPSRDANPLAKRPKHRAKEAARQRTVVVPPPAGAAPAPAPTAAPAAPAPPPRGLADIRKRLEGVRGRVKALEGGLQPPPTGEPETVDFA